MKIKILELTNGRFIIKKGWFTPMYLSYYPFHHRVRWVYYTEDAYEFTSKEEALKVFYQYIPIVKSKEEIKVGVQNDNSNN